MWKKQTLDRKIWILFQNEDYLEVCVLILPLYKAKSWAATSWQTKLSWKSPECLETLAGILGFLTWVEMGKKIIQSPENNFAIHNNTQLTISHAFPKLAALNEVTQLVGCLITNAQQLVRLHLKIHFLSIFSSCWVPNSHSPLRWWQK